MSKKYTFFRKSSILIYTQISGLLVRGITIEDKLCKRDRHFVLNVSTSNPNQSIDPDMM